MMTDVETECGVCVEGSLGGKKKEPSVGCVVRGRALRKVSVSVAR